MQVAVDDLETRIVDLCLVYESANLPVDAESVEALATAVVGKASKVLGAQLATFFVRDLHNDVWTVAATAGHCSTTADPFTIETVQSEADPDEFSIVTEAQALGKIFPGSTATQAVVAKVVAGIDHHGFLCLGRVDSRAFSSEQLRYFRILAMRSGPLLEKAQLSHALRREAVTDSLTGLWNRRQLQSDLDNLPLLWKDAREVSLLMFDLRSFKRLNDTFGHARGDAVLRDFASALSTHAPDGARVYRLAGDEFVVLASDYAATEHNRYLNLLHTSLQGMGRSSDEQPLVGFDVGIARYPSDAEDADGLLRTADARMYEMKRSR